jgi:hypothetical protein
MQNAAGEKYYWLKYRPAGEITALIKQKNTHIV